MIAIEFGKATAQLAEDFGESIRAFLSILAGIGDGFLEVFFVFLFLGRLFAGFVFVFFLLGDCFFVERVELADGHVEVVFLLKMEVGESDEAEARAVIVCFIKCFEPLGFRKGDDLRPEFESLEDLDELAAAVTAG